MSTIRRQHDKLIAVATADLTDSEWAALRQDLLTKVRATHCKIVLLDLAEVDVLDSFATRMLSALSRSIELLGAQTIVVGIQPGVAFAMAQLGLRLDHAHIALDIDEGLAMASRVRGSA